MKLIIKRKRLNVHNIEGYNGSIEDWVKIHPSIPSIWCSNYIYSFYKPISYCCDTCTNCYGNWIKLGDLYGVYICRRFRLYGYL